MTDPEHCDDIMEAIQRAVDAMPAMPSLFPIRVKSAAGEPPQRDFVRCCRTCKADFLGLAPGRTGERGLWSAEGWFCSMECAPQDLRDIAEARKDPQ